MKYELFLSNYLRTIYSPEGDDVFAALKVTTGALSSPRVGKLLNMAVNCMDDEERYVETGVLTGGSLIAATYDNRKPVVAIDNFDTKGPDSSIGCEIDPELIKAKLKMNVERFQVVGQVVEGDFRYVDLVATKVGVSFIDARHDYKSVTDNLEWIKPNLVDNAVVIFDDVDCIGVADAILDWLQKNKSSELLFFSRSKNKMDRTVTYDKTFTNGLAVIHYGLQ